MYEGKEVFERDVGPDCGFLLIFVFFSTSVSFFFLERQDWVIDAFLRPRDSTTISSANPHLQFQDGTLETEASTSTLFSRILYSKKTEIFIFTMERLLSRPAFGRNKQVLSGKRMHNALSNHRYHYNLHGFLHKRRGGGGASPSSGSASSGKPDNVKHCNIHI